MSRTDHDALVTVRPSLERVGDFAGLLCGAADSAEFVANVEPRLGRLLAPGKRGRKEKATGDIGN